MGNYLYTMGGKTIIAPVFSENRKAKIATAKFLCKDDDDIFQKHRSGYSSYKKERATIKRAEKLILKGFTADYLVIDSDCDVQTVYVFKPRSIFCDTPKFPFEIFGTYIKSENKIIPLVS